MPRQVIAGEPGTRWLNETGKIYWQAVCSFSNSCGSCIADAGQVSESWWPFPYHRGCNCINQKILPGTESLEFLDFQQEIRQLDPAQQARVIGRNAWRLVEEGVVRWEDVVTRSRIRPLKDVVARLDLTEEALVRAGIPRAVAAEALARSDPAGRAATAAALRAGEAELTRRGLTPEAVRSAVARDLVARVGVVGPGKPPPPAPAPIPGVPPPPVPAAYRLPDPPAGVPTALHMGRTAFDAWQAAGSPDSGPLRRAVFNADLLDSPPEHWEPIPIANNLVTAWEEAPAAMGPILEAAGLYPAGTIGEVVPFRPGEHAAPEGSGLWPGDPVRVVRPGWRLRDDPADPSYFYQARRIDVVPAARPVPPAEPPPAAAGGVEDFLNALGDR